jgi:hypothetical protein
MLSSDRQHRFTRRNRGANHPSHPLTALPAPLLCRASAEPPPAHHAQHAQRPSIALLLPAQPQLLLFHAGLPRLSLGEAGTLGSRALRNRQRRGGGAAGAGIRRSGLRLLRAATGDRPRRAPPSSRSLSRCRVALRELRPSTSPQP